MSCNFLNIWGDHVTGIPTKKFISFGESTVKVYYRSEPPAYINYIPIVKGVHQGKVCTFLGKTKKRVKVHVEGVGVRYLKQSSLSYVPSI